MVNKIVKLFLNEIADLPKMYPSRFGQLGADNN